MSTNPGVKFSRGGRSEHRGRVEGRERVRRTLRSHPAYPIEGRLTPLEAADYRDSDPLVCLLCGRTFQRLGMHLSRIHDLTSKAYCERYGIPWRWRGNQGLHTVAESKRAADATSEESRRAWKEMCEKSRKKRPPTGAVDPILLKIRRARSKSAPRACKECGVVYRPRARGKGFCSRQCAAEHRARVRGWKPRTCVECGKALPEGSQRNGVKRHRRCHAKRAGWGKKKVCPKCGGPKAKASARCWGCYLRARQGG